MGIDYDSLKGGGNLRNARIEYSVEEPEVVTYNEDGTVATYDPGGTTGVFINAEGSTVNTKFGDLFVVLHTLIKNGFQVGIGADGLWYFGRGNWYGGADGLVGRNDAGEVQVQLYTNGSILAAGGALVIGLNAVELTGLLYSITHTAEYSGNTRTLRYGMVVAPGASTPAGEILFSSAPGSELMTNGDFETSTLANWTKTTETNGAWSENTDAAFVRSGSKSAKWLPTASSSTGVLTSDRIGVTAGNSHEFTGYVYNAPSQVGFGTRTVQLKWYDDASAGSLIKTDTIVMSAVNSQWNLITGTYTAPTGALSVAIVVTLANPSFSSFTAVYIDDFSLAVVSVARSIRFLPEITFGGGFTQTEYGTVPSDTTDGYGATGFDMAGNPTAVNDSGQKWGLGGIHSGRQLIINTTTKTSIYALTMKPNAMSARGFLALTAFVEVNNTTGSPETITLDADLGGANQFSTALPSISSAANNRIAKLYVRLYNDGAANFNVIMAKFEVSNGVAQDTWAGQDFVRYIRSNSSVDTGASALFELHITLSTASNNFFVEMGGFSVVGPVAID